jgi:hypothetical protein
VKQLALAPNLSLPIEAVTKKFGFFGQNGTGKTYAAMKLAELMLDAGAQIVVIDPVGKWYGLRLAENGVDPSGIEIPVFGGLHGDIPLESTGGELMADLIVDRGISAILDVSQFDYDAERARFVEHFARRIFNRKKSAPSAIHVFIEEAQEFLPDRPNKGEEKMGREVLRLGKIGRNHGFGWSLITPRPQEITTKARNLSEVVLAFQTNGTHERKAIADWVKEKGADLNVVELLPKLKPGFAHAWSPSWLEFSDTIHINPKRTFDASATPKVGAKAVEARPLGSIDLEKLQKAMASTIERAKADDPKELRKEVAALRRQLEGKSGKVVEKPVVDQHAIDRAVARAIANERKRLAPVLARLQRIATAVTTLDLPAAVGALAQFVAETVTVAPVSQEPNRTAVAAPIRSVERVRPPTEQRPLVDGLSGAQQKILNAVATLNELGVEQPSLVQIALFVGVSHTTGSYQQNVRDLAEQFHYLDRGKGQVNLTASGRKIARADVDRDPIEFWKQKLPGAQSKLLSLILEHAPISKEELAGKAGVSHTTGSYQQNLRDMRTYGIIDIESGQVAPSELLFPHAYA